MKQQTWLLIEKESRVEVEQKLPKHKANISN